MKPPLLSPSEIDGFIDRFKPRVNAIAGRIESGEMSPREAREAILKAFLDDTAKMFAKVLVEEMLRHYPFPGPWRRRVLAVVGLRLVVAARNWMASEARLWPEPPAEVRAV